LQLACLEAIILSTMAAKAEKGFASLRVVQQLTQRTVKEGSKAKIDSLIARTDDVEVKHLLTVEGPLAIDTIIASETAPKLIVVVPLSMVVEAVGRRNQTAEDVRVASRDRDVEARRVAAIADAQQFIETNGLADVFGIRKKKLSFEFLKKRVAAEILFVAVYPSRPGKRAIFPRGEDSIGKLALIEAAFRAQEKINKQFLNNKRNVCSDAGQIGFYVHDLFSLIQRDSPTNRIPSLVNAELMKEWKARWWGFPDVNASRKTAKSSSKAIPSGKQQ
jgi:hypothetical protein